VLSCRARQAGRQSGAQRAPGAERRRARRGARRSCAGQCRAPARRHLSSRLFNSPHATFNPLYDFLRTLQNNGEPLMIGKRLSDVEAMQKALTAAEKLLRRSDAQVAPRPPWPRASPQPTLVLMCEGLQLGGCTWRQVAVSYNKI